MTRLNDQPRRPARNAQQHRIAQALRQAIVDGTYAAGCRLPDQFELAQQFTVSGFTVHRALDQLAREGFIRKRQRLGTHVVDAPPHLTNLAIVFPQDPRGREHYSKFFQSLANAALACQHERQRPISLFHGINQHTDVEDRQRLVSRIEAHQFAGIIFASQMNYLEGTPILDEPGVPRVSIAADQWRPHMPSVVPDVYSFLDRALDHLAARGRRRIALLRVRGLYGDDNPRVAEALARRGLVSPPHWRLVISQEVPEGARNVVRLLMHGDKAERPDGLIVCDDNLVQEVQAGLIASGARVGEEVDVVEHCNFPWARSVLTTRRLGFDSRRILRVCIDLVDRQRRSEAVPGVTFVPAEFEDELTGNGSAPKSVASDEVRSLSETARRAVPEGHGGE